MSDGPRQVQFGPIQGGEPAAAAPSSIELLKDVPLEIHAELGRARRLVKEILRLQVGSVVELDKEAGDPVDLLVNNKTIARGEVVDIDGKYGIRITEIVR